VLIVVLVIENPFHALVRNTSCNGRLTQQVIVRLAVTILQAIYDEEIAGGILVTDVPGSVGAETGGDWSGQSGSLVPVCSGEP